MIELSNQALSYQYHGSVNSQLVNKNNSIIGQLSEKNLIIFIPIESFEMNQNTLNDRIIQMYTQSQSQWMTHSFYCHSPIHSPTHSLTHSLTHWLNQINLEQNQFDQSIHYPLLKVMV